MTETNDPLLLAVRNGAHVTGFVRENAQAAWDYQAVGRYTKQGGFRAFNPGGPAAGHDWARPLDALFALEEEGAALSPVSMISPATRTTIPPDTNDRVFLLCLYADFWRNIAVAMERIGVLATADLDPLPPTKAVRQGVQALLTFDLGRLAFQPATDGVAGRLLVRYLDRAPDLPEGGEHGLVLFARLLRREGRKVDLTTLREAYPALADDLPTVPGTKA